MKLINDSVIIFFLIVLFVFTVCVSVLATTDPYEIVYSIQHNINEEHAHNLNYADLHNYSNVLRGNSP